MEEQKKADEQKVRLEQREQELLLRLQLDAKTISELQEKLNITSKPADEMMPLEQLEVIFIFAMISLAHWLLAYKMFFIFGMFYIIGFFFQKYSNIFDIDMMKKEEMGENEVSQADLNRSNSIGHDTSNHINLTVSLLIILALTSFIFKFKTYLRVWFDFLLNISCTKKRWRRFCQSQKFTFVPTFFFFDRPAEHTNTEHRVRLTYL